MFISASWVFVAMPSTIYLFNLKYSMRFVIFMQNFLIDDNLIDEDVD